MILLQSKSDNTKAILIGETDNDHKVLTFLFDVNIVWGFYQLTHICDKNKDDAQVMQILSRYPNATCIAYLNSPQGFVINKQIKDDKGILI